MAKRIILYSSNYKTLISFRGIFETCFYFKSISKYKVFRRALKWCKWTHEETYSLFPFRFYNFL